MDPLTGLPPDAPLVAAGVFLLVALALRELLGGALRAAGADLWAWAKRRAARRADRETGRGGGAG